MSEARVPDAIVFGEALVDFLPERTGPLRDVETFRKVSGGAPANVAVGMARLGARPRLLTRLGRDEFGFFLRDQLGREGIDVERCRFTDEARTGITFVCISETGERSFMPYRSSSADLTIHPDDFRDESLEAPIFHLGSNLMPYETGRRATFQLLDRAYESGRLISFDANLRLHLWPSPEDAFEAVYDAFRRVDLVKLSDEEFELLGGDPDAPHALWNRLRERGVRWLVLTLGANGARVLGHDGTDLLRPGRPFDIVDTTGAGDGFVSGLLYGILQLADGHAVNAPRELPDTLDADAWGRILDLANHVGGSACTRLGAVGGLPLHADIPWAELGWATP